MTNDTNPFLARWWAMVHDAGLEARELPALALAEEGTIKWYELIHHSGKKTRVAIIDFHQNGYEIFVQTPGITLHQDLQSVLEALSEVS